MVRERSYKLATMACYLTYEFIRETCERACHMNNNHVLLFYLRQLELQIKYNDRRYIMRNIEATSKDFNLKIYNLNI